MLLLTGTSDEIRLASDSSVTTYHCHASWIDQAAGVFTPGRKNTIGLAFSSNLVVVPSPSSGVQRNVQTLIVRSVTGPVSRINLRHFDGTSVAQIRDQIILPSDHFLFMDGLGFKYFRIQETANRLRLPADVTTSAASPVAITQLSKVLLPGTWIFRAHLIYTSSVITNGIKVDVNLTTPGAPHNFLLFNARWVDSSALGSTSPSQNIAGLGAGGVAGAGAVMSAFSRRNPSLAGIPTVNVDTANSDLLMTLEGVVENVSTTTLFIYFGSEVGGNSVTLRAGSTVWFEPYFSVSGLV